MPIEWKTGAHAPNSTWAVLGDVMLVLWLTPDKNYPGDVPEGASRHWHGRVRVNHAATEADGCRVSASVEFQMNLGNDLPKAKEAIIREFMAFAGKVTSAAKEAGG